MTAILADRTIGVLGAVRGVQLGEDLIGPGFWLGAVWPQRLPRKLLFRHEVV
jgi:hypothetical protein